MTEYKAFKHMLSQKLKEQNDMLKVTSSSSALEYITGYKKGLEWALRKLEEMEDD